MGFNLLVAPVCLSASFQNYEGVSSSKGGREVNGLKPGQSCFRSSGEFKHEFVGVEKLSNPYPYGGSSSGNTLANHPVCGFFPNSQASHTGGGGGAKNARSPAQNKRLVVWQLVTLSLRHDLVGTARLYDICLNSRTSCCVASLFAHVPSLHSDEENKLRSTLQTEQPQRQKEQEQRSKQPHFAPSRHESNHERAQSLRQRSSGNSEQGDSFTRRMSAESVMQGGTVDGRKASCGHGGRGRANSDADGTRGDWCSERSEGEIKDGNGRVGASSDGERGRRRRQRGRTRSQQL